MRPTWEQIERAALDDPVFQQTVDLARAGTLTLVEALTAAAQQLSELNADRIQERIDRLKMAPGPLSSVMAEALVVQVARNEEVITAGRDLLAQTPNP